MTKAAEATRGATVMIAGLKGSPSVRVLADTNDPADEAADEDAAGPTARKSDYTLALNEGTLTVDKAPLTVTTGSAEKEYDGKPLTNSEATITGLADGESVTITATGSQTEVGSSKNTSKLAWGDVDPNNYEIVEENLGTLTVTPNQGTPVPGPKTGDTTNIMVPAGTMIASIIALIVLVLFRRKRRYAADEQ